ncbi:MAG TPA: phosphatidylserine decarboxylase [Sedimenticola sp.]|nr:phosphatidylserine decarboxylase [Sedimenticola sp.]
MTPGLKDRLLTNLLRVLPQHALSGLMYRATRVTWKPFKNALIKEVVNRYAVDMFEAENPRPTSYACFNDFFTRALKADARPIAAEPDAVASPADGKINQAGYISDGRLLQAKGHDFSLLQLLGGRYDLAGEFADGGYVTIYLSPRDYHRVHMPVTGRLREMIFVPGNLFSVSEATTHLVPGLFARNERVICLFDTAAGPMAVILVGAIFVGSMETVWAGEVRGPAGEPTTWLYAGNQPVVLKKGEEMGRFNMGSTVITLFARDRVQWDPALVPGVRVRMGQRIGRIRPGQGES